MNRPRRTAATSKNYMESSDGLEGESSDTSDDDSEDEVETAPNTNPYGVIPNTFYTGFGKTFQRHLDVVMRSPTGSDVAIASHNVQEGLRAIESLELKLEKARAGVVELEEERKKLKEDIHVNRSISSNIRAIPDEILSIIFEFYVEDVLPPGPWVLMSVCRQWRAAAIQARRIWSKILIKVGCDRSRHFNLRWARGEICYSPALLQEALDRAGGAQLEIHLQTLNSGSGVDGTKFASFVNCLKSNKAYLRIRAFHTQDCSISLLRKAQLDDFEFSALERLSLTAAGADIHERIVKTAHQLRFLDLYKPKKGELSWDLSLMHQLDGLSIDGSHSECSHEVILMIGSAPRLTTLRLANIKILDSPEHKATSIPSLLFLHLSCVEVKCKLDLPVLKRLFMSSSMVSNGRMYPLTLPSLTSLKIAYARDEDDLCIRTPALDVLDLTLRSSKTSTHLIVKRVLDNSIVVGQMSPRRFRLDIDSLKAGDLITILTHMPRLEEWTFLGTITSPKSFFDKLAGRSLGATKGRTTNKVPLCPSMTTIFFDIRSWHSTNAANVEQWYEEAVRARRKGQYPIKEAFLKESESGKYVRL